MKILPNIIFCGLIAATFQVNAQDVTGWRGPGRTGIYDAPGLMKEWPAEGPAMHWMLEGLPTGYSSPSFGNGLIYLTGLRDSSDVLMALDSTGIVWSLPFGRAWMQSFRDSRSTPTVDGRRIYVCSGRGDVACVDGLSGQLLWSRKASEEFGGSYGGWGISESLLVDEARVYFTPGGKETTTVALDKLSGELAWKTPSLEDDPAYVSPVMIEENGRRLLVNVSASFVFAVDVEQGEFAWTFRHLDVNSEKSTAVWPRAPMIKCVTPIYHDGRLWVTGGYDHGSMKLHLPENGNDPVLAWFDSTLDIHMGGAVLVDGKIYGANWLSNGDGNWCCLDWESGAVLFETHWENKGSIIAAGDMLIIYEEKRGHVALLDPSDKELKLRSSFRVEGGSGPHWAHPVVYRGDLYIRHGDALMVYDISL